VTRHDSFPHHAVAKSLRQTTPRAPAVEPASSLALIPAAIVENAYQRSRISLVIARKCPSDAHSMKRPALHNRPPRHNQNIKSP
jgi:hypothetical protein